MELVISGLALAKFFLFLALSGFLAFMCLFPVSDQPTTKGQWIFYCITEVLVFCFMFGFISIKLTA